MNTFFYLLKAGEVAYLKTDDAIRYCYPVVPPVIPVRRDVFVYSLRCFEGVLFYLASAFFYYEFVHCIFLSFLFSVYIIPQFTRFVY